MPEKELTLSEEEEVFLNAFRKLVEHVKQHKGDAYYLNDLTAQQLEKIMGDDLKKILESVKEAQKAKHVAFIRAHFEDKHIKDLEKLFEDPSKVAKEGLKKLYDKVKEVKEIIDYYKENAGGTGKRMKQIVIVRQDLKLPKGKLVTQTGHAFVDAVLNSKADVVQKWKKEGMMKVALKVENEEELFKYKKLADELGVVNRIITDEGRTTIRAGTVTCLGLGPDDEEKMNKITGNLKLL